MFDAISKIGEKIISIPSLVFDAFKDILTNIFKVIEDIFKSILKIVDFVTNFFINLLNFIKDIFIPHDDFFIDNFNNLKSKFSDKLGVDTSVWNELYRKSKGIHTGIEPITINALGYSATIDMSFVNDVAKITRVCSTGLVMLFSVLFNYNKIVFIIRGKYAIETGGK